MWKLFSDNPKYKKRARFLAILWTLLIFFLCLIPSAKIPEVSLPLADKWTHFILFGIFSFLWLLSITSVKIRHMFLMLVIAIVLGWLVEVIQGCLPSLGRTRDNIDIVADGVGGLLGVVLFFLFSKTKP